MRNFAKSVLNYFAAFSETRFRFSRRLPYEWSEDSFTLDLSVFPDFQRELLAAIAGGTPFRVIGICFLGPRPILPAVLPHPGGNPGRPPRAGAASVPEGAILDWRGVSGALETAVKGENAAADPDAHGRRRARRPIAREPGSREGQRITQQGDPLQGIWQRVPRPVGCGLGQARGRDGSGSSR